MRIEARPVTLPPRAEAQAPAASSPQVSASASAAPRRETVDFTQMTRAELLDWMNGRIWSGELSLDDTSGLLGMTMSMPVGGGAAAPDTRQKLDFIAMARDGLAAAEARGDRDGTGSLRVAIAVMSRFQGTVTGLDITA